MEKKRKGPVLPRSRKEKEPALTGFRKQKREGGSKKHATWLGPEGKRKKRKRDGRVSGGRGIRLFLSRRRPSQKKKRAWFCAHTDGN